MRNEGHRDGDVAGRARPYDLAGRVAIVTGGSRGIGGAIAGALAAEGAVVVPAARHLDERTSALQEAFRPRASERGAPTARLHPHLVDVTDEVSVQNLVDDTVDRFGRLDILVNAAGVLVMTGLVETTTADWRRTIDVNLTGVFLCMRAAVRQMIGQTADEDGVRGAVVQIVSGAGTHGWPGASAYTASKYGVMGLSEAVREEVRARGVKVIDVLPGTVRTAMTDRAEFATRPKLVPEDVARAVVAALTASPAAMITRIDVRHQLPGH